MNDHERVREARRWLHFAREDLDGLEVPHIHDLNAVRNRLSDSWSVRREHPDLAELTVWAAESRYPGDWKEATVADADRAVSQAQGVCNSIAVEFERRINAT